MYAERSPYQGEHRQHDGPHGALRVAEESLGWLLVVFAVCGGVGWLYLLRNSHALNVGPHMRGALPLQELANHGAQPVLRMAVAWIPAGFAAGIALSLTTRMRVATIAGGVGVLSFLILFFTTVASEAVSRNERFSAYVSPVLAKGGVWTAVAFVVIGSLLAGALASRARARRRPESKMLDGTSSSAP